MTRSLCVRLSALAALATLLGCQSVDDPSFEIVQHQIEWMGHKPSTYFFDLTLVVGVLYPSCPSAAWHVAVVHDSVTSATCISSGQSVTGITKTVDSVFADALRASRNHDLTQIEFDPVLGFPTLVHVGGVPDAGWAEQVSGFQTLAVPLAL